MKKFDEWNEVKKDISKKNRKFFIKEREIYWVHLGENIGYEQNGKGDEFLRPVLVYKKFSTNLFKVKNKDNCAILSQMRLFDTQRIHDRLGKIKVEEFTQLKQKLMILLDFTPTKNSGLPEQAGNLDRDCNINNLKSQ